MAKKKVSKKTEIVEERIPIFVYALKTIILVGIFYEINLILLGLLESFVIIFVLLSCLLLYALVMRRKWGYYFGYVMLLSQATYFLLLNNITLVIVWSLPILLLYNHREFFST